jgi:hypothetical protein
MQHLNQVPRLLILIEWSGVAASLAYSFSQMIISIMAGCLTASQALNTQPQVQGSDLCHSCKGSHLFSALTQPLHPQDRAELCHDIAFRAIKATCHPRTFEQLVKCTHEWWDSNFHEPFHEFNQYLSGRRVNVGMVCLPLRSAYRVFTLRPPL